MRPQPENTTHATRGHEPVYAEGWTGGCGDGVPLNGVDAGAAHRARIRALNAARQTAPRSAGSRGGRGAGDKPPMQK
jgi:hypothetical protein